MARARRRPGLAGVSWRPVGSARVFLERRRPLERQRLLLAGSPNLFHLRSLARQPAGQRLLVVAARRFLDELGNLWRESSPPARRLSAAVLNVGRREGSLARTRLGRDSQVN